MEKIYLAVVHGEPKEREWNSRLKLSPDNRDVGRMKADAREGKDAETFFHALQSRHGTSLIEAHPLTGRMHQIRVHLAESGLPVVGDELYGKPMGIGEKPLGLRAVRLNYSDPFTRRRVEIRAPVEEFVREYGFEPPETFTVRHKPAVPPKPA